MAQIVFPILYTVIFCLGVIMNSLSVCIFCQVPTNSVFIVYLKNTVAADIIMTLALPFKIVTDSEIAPWQVKVFVCRCSAVVFYSAMYVNIILLGLIGLDRFLKIVRPFERRCMDRLSVAKRISLSVWIVIFGISMPNMMLNNKTATPENVSRCSALKTPLGMGWHKAVTYISQLIFWSVFISMTVFYTVISKKVYESYRKSHSKDKTVTKNTKAKVFIVVIVFFLCFAPYHFMRVPYTFSQSGIITDCSLKRMLFLAKESTLWIAATNIFMDPFIYIVLCKPFRKLLPGFSSLGNSSQETPINESTM
ncbi:PREDICTED: P2Y purinoceptor 13-like [Nanorana parkeri]|uniref:P2Y purinoceptor 13-like n=1 Tax=Nanorana parkeri TaxID=125878 RepID=UPI0008550C79|nr:PREDICTED: P2Y purinoceptor 13-like [Nanorana parkeri]